MRLMTFTLERYRRFENEAKLDVASEVVALVGPNEAGKSSILAAMISFNDDSVIDDRDHTRDATGQTKLTAGYILDDDDRDAIEKVSGKVKVKWWTLEKRQNGEFSWAIHPPLKRDLSQRQKLVQDLTDVYSSGQIESASSIVDDDLTTFFEQALSALSSEGEDLDVDEIDAIESFGSFHRQLTNYLASDPENAVISPAFVALLRDLASYREGEHANDLAGQLLMARRPQFLLFKSEDRELRSSYDLVATSRDRPLALQNLARLANINVDHLQRAAVQSDVGLRTTLLKNANAELAVIFRDAWSQFGLDVRLEMDMTELTILVSHPGDRFTELEQRSEGLQAFVALRAFLERFDSPTKPVLLIDEAETHLHYDAQADLVNVLTHQEYAAKVIYTTHSAGCLPRDLGNGIRSIVPERNKSRSTIVNNLWGGHAAGFTPVAFAMGATTFAFLPSRHVLIGEGNSDAMLYPTLFREVAEMKTLPFQVAPGLATVAATQIPRLMSEGGTVAFIVDGDAAGDAYCDALEAAGVDSDCIFSLANSFEQNTEVEDLIEPSHYAFAVNAVLKTFRDAASEFQSPDIPNAGRTTALEAWCQLNGLLSPDKTTVAQKLLEMKSESARKGGNLQLLAEVHRERLAELVRRISAVLSS